MTPHPFYRSRLFWLGLPGLVFFLWLCLGNPQNRKVKLAHGDYFATVGGHYRAMRIEWESREWIMQRTPGLQIFRAGQSPGDVDKEEKRFFPRAIRHDVREYEYYLQSRLIPQVSLAYWFLLLIYLALWLPFLAYWQHRKARLLKLHASPPL